MFANRYSEYKRNRSEQAIGRFREEFSNQMEQKVNRKPKHEKRLYADESLSNKAQSTGKEFYL